MRCYSKLILILSTVTVLFNSCKNDLNILAPYKETVSVYALLNPQESRQYVRINKIFLGEGNAYVMATVQDSVNYKPGVLTVSLERHYNGVPDLTTMGNPTKTKIILKDTVVQLNPGPFNTNQRLFYTDDKLFPYGDYHLTITNNQTGNVFTSTTLMIDSIAATGIIQPLGVPYYPVAYSPSNPAWYYLDLSVQTVKHDIRFVSVKNARDYNVVMRFHYKDYFLSGDSASQYVDYNFGRISSIDLLGGEQLTVSYYASDFFSVLHSRLIASTPNILMRRAIKMDFMVIAGAQNFVDFLEISAPSTTVAQDKPTYSNIEGGGFGIFSCRSRFLVSKHLANVTINYMATKKPICDLLFLDASGAPGSTCN